MGMTFSTGRASRAALLAAVVMTSAPACATQAYAVRGSYSNAGFDRGAADQGYRRGFDEGRDDARHHRSYAPERHGVYRDAQRGYRGDWERDADSRGFRSGFEAGYRDGFDRYARDYRR
jgi:hypothetical protein